MKHLIVVGACYLDTILENVSLTTRTYHILTYRHLNIRRGGNCPNSLEVLQQMLSEREALQLHLVSPLPNATSSATRRIVSSFGSRSKIDFSHCIYRDESTEAASSYIFRSEESGSRTLVNYNDLPEMTEDEFGNIARSFEPDQETWWHFEGRIPDTVQNCIRLLRNVLPKATISVEAEKPGREGLPELAAEADVVFYSRSWAESRGHETPEECLKAEGHHKASLALCTWGADGAAGLSRSTGEILRCPAQDESGGDISVVDDWSMGKKLGFAVQLATLKVQREGFDRLGEDMLGIATGTGTGYGMGKHDTLHKYGWRAWRSDFGARVRCWEIK
ncbi:hypothetical protein F53441_5082 [Fusarium austroafricanum]|uniref:Carbohydrate kinase PfkB domain-containing protein n=1 Tax=Fusarium austroafricanum TaxID=2364996 RepID=A0A8H4NUS7_9HYPO|nr:hypothetical protein F53441_5082 [Fusarium austroafricanum]